MENLIKYQPKIAPYKAFKQLASITKKHFALGEGVYWMPLHPLTLKQLSRGNQDRALRRKLKKWKI